MTTLLLDNIKSSDPINLKRLLEARNKSGTTALMIAVDQRDFPLIELLIGTAGADVKAVDGNGDTALIRATKNLTEDNDIPPIFHFRSWRSIRISTSLVISLRRGLTGK